MTFVPETSWERRDLTAITKYTSPPVRTFCLTLGKHHCYSCCCCCLRGGDTAQLERSSYPQRHTTTVGHT